MGLENIPITFEKTLNQEVKTFHIHQVSAIYIPPIKTSIGGLARSTENDTYIRYLSTTSFYKPSSIAIMLESSSTK